MFLFCIIYFESVVKYYSVCVVFILFKGQDTPGRRSALDCWVSPAPLALVRLVHVEWATERVSKPHMTQTEGFLAVQVPPGHLAELSVQWTGTIILHIISSHLLHLPMFSPLSISFFFSPYNLPHTISCNPPFSSSLPLSPSPTPSSILLHYSDWVLFGMARVVPEYLSFHRAP